MTNLEKIRAMSAEELSSLINKEATCGFCIHQHETCSEDDVCWQGVVDWLNKEDNPMPKIQIGDCILTHINKSLVMLVVLSDIYASNLHGVMVRWRELKNILKIKRINDENGCVEVIWRAGDDR